jgi:hypothetical protein
MTTTSVDEPTAMGVSVFTGPVFVVRDNIDTDQIIPAEYLSLIPSIARERAALGAAALCGLPDAEYPVRLVADGETRTHYPSVFAYLFYQFINFILIFSLFYACIYLLSFMYFNKIINKLY